jgi:hypothetical protein
LLLQHSLLVMQASPTLPLPEKPQKKIGMRILLVVHLLLTQLPLQQSFATMHAALSGEHVVHMLLRQRVPSQQMLPATPQLTPAGRQLHVPP